MSLIGLLPQSMERYILMSNQNEPHVEKEKTPDFLIQPPPVMSHYDVTKGKCHTASTNNETCSQIPLWQNQANFLSVNFWIGPLVVLYWAGTWNLLFTYIVVIDDEYLKIWVLGAVGFGIYILFCVTQDIIRRICMSNGTVWLFVTTRIYIYIYGLASVFQWLSIWEGWTIYTTSTLNNGLITCGVSTVVMAILRLSLPVVGPPCVAAMDSPNEKVFTVDTYFNTKVGTWKHFPDSVVSWILVPFLVVTRWRGLWLATDNFLCPDDATLSGLYTLVIAYSLSFILFVTRPMWMKLSAWSDDKVWILKFIVEDIHTLLQSIVCIYHWRGIWLLFDTHILEPPTRYWVGHGVGFVGLMMTCASKSVVPNFCVKDGSMTKGQGVNLDMYYVTNVLKVFQKKEQRPIQMTSNGLISTIHNKDESMANV